MSKKDTNNKPAETQDELLETTESTETTENTEAPKEETADTVNSTEEATTEDDKSSKKTSKDSKQDDDNFKKTLDKAITGPNSRELLAPQTDPRVVGGILTGLGLVFMVIAIIVCAASTSSTSNNTDVIEGTQILKVASDVDLGHGLKATADEYNTFAMMYDTDIKNTLLELKSVERALNDLGITLTQDELNEAVKNQAEISGIDEGTADYANLKINMQIELLSNKGIEYYSQDKDTDATDEEVEAEVQSAIDNGLRMIAGDYKVTSLEDGNAAIEAGRTFETIDSDDTYEILDSGHDTNLQISNADTAEVGDMLTEESNGTMNFIKVTGINEDLTQYRESVRGAIKDRKASDKFQELVTKTLVEVGLIEDDSSTDTGEDIASVGAVETTTDEVNTEGEDSVNVSDDSGNVEG